MNLILLLKIRFPLDGECNLKFVSSEGGQPISRPEKKLERDEVRPFRKDFFCVCMSSDCVEPMVSFSLSPFAASDDHESKRKRAASATLPEFYATRERRSGREEAGGRGAQCELYTGNLYKAIPRLRECSKQVEAEVLSNSRNKIHQTWKRPY